jgi:hypothetical protein
MKNNITTQSAIGYFVMVPEWVLYLPITASALRVYCVIRRHADSRTGQCFPSRKLIAHKSNVTTTTVDRCIKELVLHGAITVNKRRSKNGDWTSNLYTIHSLPTNDPQVATLLALPSNTSTTTGRHKTEALTKPITNEKQEHADYDEHIHKLCQLGAELFDNGATLEDVEQAAIDELGNTQSAVVTTYLALRSLRSKNTMESL